MPTSPDFDAIYAEFQPKIERYLRRLAGVDDAPDLTQAVFLKVHQGLSTFRGDASLSTWIYRIATNTAHDHRLAAGARQRSVEELCADPDDLTAVADPAAVATDHDYIRREMSACVRGVVEDLPATYREVLLLSEFEGFTNLEIAAILGVSLDTVKIRLHRGRQRLRQALECACSLYHDERNELMCDRKPAKKSSPRCILFFSLLVYGL